MDMTREAAERWLMSYGAAWEHADPAGAAHLFTDDCRYYETPFSDPAAGREGVRTYWQVVPDRQREVVFGYQVLAVQAQTVIAHWTASFTRVPTDVRVHLDGMFVLEFSADGLCRTLREWWHRHEAPPA